MKHLSNACTGNDPRTEEGGHTEKQGWRRGFPARHEDFESVQDDEDRPSAVAESAHEGLEEREGVLEGADLRRNRGGRPGGTGAWVSSDGARRFVGGVAGRGVGRRVGPPAPGIFQP